MKDKEEKMLCQPYLSERRANKCLYEHSFHQKCLACSMESLIDALKRNSSIKETEEIVDIAVKCHTSHPDIVVGIELSGNPMVGNFSDFVPPLEKAREAGLKVTLHCGEVCNPKEVLEMLNFKPNRIGHGTCIHPNYGGTDVTWKALCDSKIPVEICLTSNVNTKSTPDYESHHFKELFEAEVPLIICTDDKGVFATSLSQEYRLCGETFGLTQSQLARLALGACQCVFAEDALKTLNDKLLNFIDKNAL